MQPPRFNPISGAAELTAQTFGIAEGFQNIFARAEALKQSKENFDMEKEQFATNQALAGLNFMKAANDLRRQNNELELQEYATGLERRKIDAQRRQTEQQIAESIANEELLAQAPEDFRKLDQLDLRDVHQIRLARIALQGKYGKLTGDPRFLRIAGDRLANIQSAEMSAMQFIETEASAALLEMQVARAQGADVSKFAQDPRVRRAISAGSPMAEKLVSEISSMVKSKEAEAGALSRVRAAGEVAVNTAKAKRGSGRPLTDTMFQSTEKLRGSYNALQEIKKTYDQMGVKGPIIGFFRDNNPWDTDAQVLASKVNSAVSGFARGVFGEVGVLTEQDMKLYKSLLPNTRSPEAAAKALFEFLSRKLEVTYRDRIRALQSQGFSTAGFDDDLEGEQESLEDAMLKAAAELGP